jgi:dCTP deaminase
MAFLPHADIVKLATAGKLFAGKYDSNNIKQASYDLKLGEEIYIVGRRAPERLSARHPYVVIPPGAFAILTTDEVVTIPANILGFIAIRTQFKLQGLVNISGFHVDPSFRGKLLFAVQNVGPADLRLKYGEPTFSIFFSELKSDDIGPSRDKGEVHFKQDLSGIRLQDVQLLGGSSLSLARLQKDVNQLRMLILVYGPFAVAAFIALLVKIFRG